jgi:hypothetical protein
MTRRVLAFVLALTIASGAQGTVMYATAAAAGDRTVADPAVQALVATATVLPTQPAAGTLAEALTDSAIQCQRGGQHQCFGYFSHNCCAEIAALMAIAGAVGAWLAAGVGAYYYWYYC